MAKRGRRKRLRRMPEQEESEDEAIDVPEQQGDGGEVIVSDRISSLPDSLLHHILSFLPTREVVGTSLLSKRWKPLWHSMPSFDFDFIGFYNLDFFIQFVDAVLLMADLKPIEKFQLTCHRLRVQRKGERTEYEGVPPSRINIWIRTAIYRKVEHFELCYNYNEYIVLPLSIFNSGTIKVLKLYWVRLNTHSAIKLPSLKVMHLANVKLPDYECLKNILSGCTLLEELVLYFEIDDDDDDQDEEEEGEEVVEEEEKDFTVNIEKLEYLVSAHIPSFLITSKAWTNVTLLWLNVGKPPVRDIPVFDNLTSLEISNLDDKHLNWIVECLRSCPKLEILVINEIKVDPNGEGALMEPILDVPQCLSSHLKEFTLYGGIKSHLEIAIYIMENARVLRSMFIYWNNIGYDGDLDELCSCPRGSVHCSLFIE